MKRLLAVCAVWMMLFCCIAAAEENRLFLEEFDDFTLTTPSALLYRGEKAEGSPLFTFYPSAEGNISLSAVNAVWFRTEDPVTAEAFTRMIQTAEAGIRAQYEAGGSTLKQFDVRPAVERELWGFPALICDAELTVGINDSEAVLVQRNIRITGSFGTYLFSLSAWSQDLLEEASDTLIRALQWKSGNSIPE